MSQVFRNPGQANVLRALPDTAASDGGLQRAHRAGLHNVIKQAKSVTL